MKFFTTQRYDVTLTDGTHVEACCGPALTAIPNVFAYRPVGEPRRDVCCHKGHAADLCRKGTATVREALRFDCKVCKVPANFPLTD